VLEAVELLEPVTTDVDFVRQGKGARFAN